MREDRTAERQDQPVWRRAAAAAYHRLPDHARRRLAPVRRRLLGGVTPRQVVWAYRILLDRDPEDRRTVTTQMLSNSSLPDLRRRLLASDEYGTCNPDPLRTDRPAVVIAEIEDGLRLFVDLRDTAIGIPVLRGTYEPAEMALVRRLLRPGDNALDVGANIGVYAVVMAGAVGEAGAVVAFEPRAQVADLLERSIAENHFQARVSLRRLAVGAEPGRLRIAYPRDAVNLGAARLVPVGGSSVSWMDTEEVEVAPLDDLELPRPVRLIKVDIEGAEPLLVRGARALLAADRPWVLSEVHPRQLRAVAGVDAAAYLAGMADLGYRCHRVGHEGVGAVARSFGDDEICSVLFVPAGAELP